MCLRNQKKTKNQAQIKKEKKCNPSDIGTDSLEAEKIMNKISYISKLFNADFVEMHEHGLWELVYCTRGFGKTIIDNKDYVFNKGEMLIIPPHIKHGDKSESSFDNIHLTVANLSIGTTGAIKIVDNHSENIHTILDLAHMAYHKKGTNYVNLLNSLYDVLINYILAYKNPTNDYDYIQQIEENIIANISNPNFNLKEFLASLPYNSEYIRQKFIEQKLISPNKYLTEKRMEYGTYLLSVKTLSQLSIREIASLCGYDDPKYFSRAFKKYTGKCPNSYII